jgi:lipoic acid synthetase
MSQVNSERRPLPAWLRVKVGKAQQGAETRGVLSRCRVNTVCREARCPNVGECFGSHTATFMILGDVCTRNCGFCAVAHGIPPPPDPDEPARVAEAAADLGLRYVVVTSVTRDDLPDSGAADFAATIRALRERIPGVAVEVLVPDLLGDPDCVATVVEAGPAVFNHNVETVQRLSREVRPQADYRRSLGVLAEAKRAAPSLPIKSGFMVGLGETDDEVHGLLGDLREAACGIVTIGQYLRPTSRHLPVRRYVPPEAFAAYQAWARDLGFAHAACGPFVRSSYQAAEAARTAIEALGSHH